jgi:hypothetical protein
MGAFTRGDCRAGSCSSGTIVHQSRNYDSDCMSGAFSAEEIPVASLEICAAYVDRMSGHLLRERVAIFNRVFTKVLQDAAPQPEQTRYSQVGDFLVHKTEEYWLEKVSFSLNDWTKNAGLISDMNALRARVARRSWL